MSIRRIPLYFFLALLGLLIGSELPQLIGPTKVHKVAVMGKNLVLAKASPNGQYVTGIKVEGSKWFLCTYDAEGKALSAPHPIEPSSGFVERVAWSSDSKSCAVAANSDVVVFQFQGRKVSSQVLPAVWQVRELRFRGSRLIARCNDTVLIWNSRLRPEWRVNIPHVLHADLSADGELLALGVFEEGVLMVDLQKRKVVGEFDPGKTPAFLRFCHDDQRLMTAYRQRAERSKDFARCYNVQTGLPLTPPMEVPYLQNCAVSDDGSRYLTVSKQGRAIWDGSNGQLLCRPDFGTPGKDCLSSNGRFAVSSIGVERAVLWDTASGDILDRIDSGASSWIAISGSRHIATVARGEATLWYYK